MDLICPENNLALFIVVEYDIPYSPARYALKRTPCLCQVVKCPKEQSEPCGEMDAAQMSPTEGT